MTKRDDGGPAFPVNPDTNMSATGLIFPETMGMTLRDWFAGQAIASAWEVTMTFRPPDDAQRPEQFCAVQAYAIADAMLKERNK